MKRTAFFCFGMLVLCACSENGGGDAGEPIPEMEKEIEAEAKSLEQAADEAVKVLAEEIDTELEDEGVSEVETPTPSREEPADLAE